MAGTRTIWAFETRRFVQENRRMPVVEFLGIFLVILLLGGSEAGSDPLELILLATVVVVPSFPSYNSFVRERTEGTVEALLATPVSARAIFWGKLLASLTWGGLHSAVILSSYLAGKLCGFLLWGHFSLPVSVDWSLLPSLLLIVLFCVLSSALNVAVGIRARRFETVVKISWVVSSLLLAGIFLALLWFGAERFWQVTALAAAAGLVAMGAFVWRLPRLMNPEELVLLT
jgi:ABC-type Na+ efflux pump permease subunit